MSTITDLPSHPLAFFIYLNLRYRGLSVKEAGLLKGKKGEKVSVLSQVWSSPNVKAFEASGSHPVRITA